MSCAKKIVKWLAIVCAILIIIGLGIFDVILYDSHKENIIIYKKCAELPLIDDLKLTKNTWAQWNWEYNDASGKFNLQHECPVDHHNVALYYKGNYVARSVGQYFDHKTIIKIYTCNGDLAFKITKNDFVRNFNGTDVNIKLLIQNSKNEDVSYIQETGENFEYMNNFIFKNISGNDIVTVSRNVFNEPWVWKYNYDYNQEGNDFRAIGIFFVVYSFTKATFNSTDSCNKYFLYTSWIIFSIVSSIFIYSLFRFVKYCKNKRNIDNSRNIQMTGV